MPSVSQKDRKRTGCTEVETVVKMRKAVRHSEGHTLIMAAIESARGVMKALDICEASGGCLASLFPAVTMQRVTDPIPVQAWN